MSFLWGRGTFWIVYILEIASILQLCTCTKVSLSNFEPNNWRKFFHIFCRKKHVWCMFFQQHVFLDNHCSQNVKNFLFLIFRPSAPPWVYHTIHICIILWVYHTIHICIIPNFWILYKVYTKFCRIHPGIQTIVLGIHKCQNVFLKNYSVQYFHKQYGKSPRILICYKCCTFS